MVIDVCDNFLARKNAADLFERLNNRGWTYGWIADKTTDSPARHWHIGLADNGYNAERSCLFALKDSKHFPELVDLWYAIAKKLPYGHQPVRVYANAHTYGVEGRFHRDCPTGAGEMTALVYLNPVWKPSWGGATLFAPDGAASTCVLPVPGRLVIFQGDIPHCACAPSRECHDLRVTLVFKSKCLL